MRSQTPLAFKALFQHPKAEAFYFEVVVCIASVLDMLCAAAGRNADLLSHEATFTADMYVKARIAQHSTAPMAGNFARQLGAQALVLTHFSGRFTEFRGKVCPLQMPPL